MEAELVDSGAQPERTALSWLRTAASVSFAALFLFRYLVEAGLVQEAFFLAGLSLLVAPALIIKGLKRAERSSAVWERVTPVSVQATLSVSISIGIFGVIVAVALLVASR